jgi:hypothetical protein
MKIQVRGRIKDLLLRTKPDGSPMLTADEANALYAKGMKPNTVYSMQIENDEPVELGK